jgi:dipeptidyl aminopeptidase/acylaminoacyl peptidase
MHEALHLVRATLLAALLPLGACSSLSAAGQELIPREVFFGNPDRAAVQLSPDGSRLTFLAPDEGVMNVWVQTIGEPDARPLTTARDRPIRRYFWAHNGEQILYVQDRDGDENFHVYAVEVGTGAEIDLTPFGGIQARVIGLDRDHPDEILVALNNRVPQFHDAWRVNTRTGESACVFQNDVGYASLTADADLDVRLATRMNADGGVTAFVRDEEEEDWYELVRWDMQDAMTSWPLAFARGAPTVYLMDSRNRNTGGLWAYTPGDTPESGYRMLAADDRADLSDVVFNPRTGRPEAVSFEHTRREWIILDDDVRADFAALRSVADGELQVVSRDHADERWVVAFTRDDGPVEFHLYDRRERQATFLFTNRTALEGRKLARMEPVVIEARDGLELVSYLTVPRRGARRNLPMVLLVHGGPWGRDRWGYNPIHQWLADRGYAVLSVNFRGSTGLGKDFINAGNREWAAAMHDDLVDAVEWAVRKRVADPERVAIMGGSYGGYATLVGLTFTPELFAAGVDIVGPSHVRTLLESIPPYWQPILAMFEARVGSLSDPEHLDSISPLTRVDAIARPLLIGQGANDPRVKEAESRQIVEAMQAKGLPVTYVLFPDEGHGFARPANSLAFFAVTEAFLAQHLGGAYEAIGSTVRESSAIVEAGAGLVPGL